MRELLPQGLEIKDIEKEIMEFYPYSSVSKLELKKSECELVLYTSGDHFRFTFDTFAEAWSEYQKIRDKIQVSQDVYESIKTLFQMEKLGVKGNE